MSLIKIEGVQSLSAPTKAQKDAAVYMFGSKGHSIVAVLDKFSRAKEVRTAHIDGLLKLMKDGDDEEIIKFTASAPGKKTIAAAKQFAVAKTLTASIKALKLVRVPMKWIEGHSDAAAARITETKEIRARKTAGNKPEKPVKLDNPHAPEAETVDNKGTKEPSAKEAKAFAANLTKSLGMEFKVVRGDATEEDPLSYEATNPDDQSAVASFRITPPFDGLPDDMKSKDKPKWRIAMSYRDGKMRIAVLGDTFKAASAKRVIAKENQARVKGVTKTTRGKTAAQLASLVESKTAASLDKLGTLDKNAFFSGLSGTVGKKLGKGYVVTPSGNGLVLRLDDGNRGARAWLALTNSGWTFTSVEQGSGSKQEESLGSKFKIADLVKRTKAWLKSPKLKAAAPATTPYTPTGKSPISLVDELAEVTARKISAKPLQEREEYFNALRTVLQNNLPKREVSATSTGVVIGGSKLHTLRLDNNAWTLQTGVTGKIKKIGATFDIVDLLGMLDKSILRPKG